MVPQPQQETFLPGVTIPAQIQEIMNEMRIRFADHPEVAISAFQKFSRDWYASLHQYGNVYNLMNSSDIGTWGQDHIAGLIRVIPAKNSSFDWYLLPHLIHNLSGEIKTSCARADGVPLTFEMAKQIRYDFYFNHYKAKYFDVSINIGVYLDRLSYWVMTSQDVREIQRKHGRDAEEGKLLINAVTIAKGEYDAYVSSAETLQADVIAAYERLKTQSGCRPKKATATPLIFS